MFTVTGTYDGTPYRVDIDPDHDGDLGTIRNIRPTGLGNVLRATVGDEVHLAHPGPIATLDLAKPETILAALRETTSVLTVTGDVPAEVQDPDVPSDAVH